LKGDMRMRRGLICMPIKGRKEKGKKRTKKGHLIRMMMMIPLDRDAQMNEDEYQKKGGIHLTLQDNCITTEGMMVCP
jgi:hypothetical protein